MTAQSQLEQYLSGFRQRLQRLIVARAAAVLAAVALVITLVAVYFGAQRAFDSGFVMGARTVLLVAVAAIVIGLLVYPLRVLRSTRGIGAIEKRVPEFDGRVETYDGMTHRADQTRSPLLGLLAEDTLAYARRIPAALRVPPMQINAPLAVAAIAAVVLLGVGAFGPDNWRFGVRNLWAGWFLSDTLPPQRIVVVPGDGTVRRGGDLEIAAHAEGFDPRDMELYAQFEPGGAWQNTFMSNGADDEFEFTFFAIREPVSYYVTAAGLRTPEYTIDVVDLPEIKNIKLTYEYPDWTHLSPETQDPGNDISAVADTRVTVQIETDRPLDNAALVANGESVDMNVEGNLSTAELTVNEDGEYYISTLFDDDAVRLSDDYFISVVEDKEPVVNVVKPGRDWRASNIEEVTVRVEANDDFGLENFELRYSLNGGEWQSAPLEIDNTTAKDEHVLYLEDMSKPVRQPRGGSAGNRGMPLTIDNLRALREANRARDESTDTEAAAEVPPAPAVQGLEPGDLISYYVVAKDREQTVQTDLYFVEVQPFDRRFTQATSAGGGGGGGGGQQQNEISDRQKEILVATWNLIREQGEDASFLDEQQMHDNAQMLAELQRTLAEQAETLANRTRARQLTNADEKIARFVESLELAVEAMSPAAERLADISLEEAVPSEQEALQHLLRAESVFSDIQVAFQRGGGGGGGGLAGRDLSELFELEMDLEKNQYETDSPAALSQEQTPESEVDDAIAKLQELARRQQALARQSGRRAGPTEQERWQQEQLKRETEELRRELEDLQQRMAQAQQAQQQGAQQGQQQGQQQSGQQGQGGQTAQNGQPQSGGQGGISPQALRDIDNALQAMNRAAQNGQPLDPEQARRAIEQAQRELDQALKNMTAQRQSDAVDAFSDLADRASDLYDQQRQLAEELQSSLQRSVDNQVDQGARRGGLPREDLIGFSERKFDLQEALDALEQDIQSVAQDFRSRTPGASDELRDSLADLQRSQASTRLQYGAQALRQGAAQQVAATDAVTTSALRDLERSTEQALAKARVEAVEGENPDADPNADLVAEIQALRRALTDMTANEQANGQGGQAQQGQNQQGGSAQAGGQLGGGQFGPNGFGGGARGFYDPNRMRAWGAYNPDFWRDPQAVDRLRQQLSDAGTDLLTQTTRLRGEGVSEEELRAMRELGERLRAGLTGGRNPEIIAAEFQGLVNLAEQLELRLQEGSADGETAIRTEAPSQFAPGYEEEVAEYYRRLSRISP